MFYLSSSFSALLTSEKNNLVSNEPAKNLLFLLILLVPPRWVTGTQPMGQYLVAGPRSAHARFGRASDWPHDRCRAEFLKAKDGGAARQVPVQIFKQKYLYFHLKRAKVSKCQNIVCIYAKCYDQGAIFQL